MTGRPIRITLNRWTVEEIEQPTMRHLKTLYPGVRILLEDAPDSQAMVLEVVSSEDTESGTPEAAAEVERAIRDRRWM